MMQMTKSRPTGQQTEKITSLLPTLRDTDWESVEGAASIMPLKYGDGIMQDRVISVI